MAKPLKKKGALLKLIGSAILFLSFITQNFFYESWREQADTLFSAAQSRALIDKGALINETSFFVLSSSNLGSALPDQQAVATYKIRQYALKVYQSEAVAILALRSIDQTEKAAVINALHVELNKVHDYRSAATFTDFINTRHQKYADLSRAETHSINERRTFAKWGYLVLYTIGAAILLLGLRFEWLGAEE